MGALIAILAICVGAVVWGITSENNYVNRVNSEFTQKCSNQGGQTIIGDKDLCFSSDGRLLFHE